MDLLYANDQKGRYPNSYYAASARMPDARPTAYGPLSCDICIIGAGFTGLSSALNLAQKGFDVVLLDAQRVGFGASGRNGGQVGAGQRLEQDALEKIVGLKAARALWDISIDAVNYVKSLCNDDQMHCRFYPGIVHPDHRKRFVSHSLDYARKLNQDYGYDQIRGLDLDEMRALVGSDAYYGGTLDMGSGHIHPLKFALGLAQKATRAGVRIFENSRVTNIDQSHPVKVQTELAEIKCDKLILACNGYLGSLENQVAAKVMPINNFIIATEPLGRDLRRDLIRENFAVADSKFVVNYFRFSEDHRLLFGGSESYGYRFPKDIAHQVRKPMLEIYPQLKHTRIDYAWGGTLAITMNRMPHFARLNEHIFSMSGYSGHGVALATYSGRMIAEALSGNGEKFGQLAAIPMQKFPGGVALRSPLLVAAMLYYSLLDRL